MNPTENIQLSWSEFQTATTRFISSVQNSNDFVDVTLACDDDKMVEAHRVVISAGSSFFEGILRKTGGHPHPLLYLRGIKKEQLDSILTFLYRGETSVEKEHLDAFLALARDLGVRGFSGEQRENHAQLDINIQTTQLDGGDNSSQLLENYEIHTDTDEDDAVIPTENPLIDDKKTELNTNDWKDIMLFPPALHVYNNEDSKIQTSDVWQFGGFCKDDLGNLLKSHVMCGVCGLRIRYYNNTTNFKHHLTKHHPIEYLGKTDDVDDTPRKLIDYQSKEAKSILYDIIEKPNPIQTEDENGQGNFACIICQKQFKTTSSLGLHSNIHLPEMPFNCTFCGKGFSQKIHWKTHLERSHADGEGNRAKKQTELPSWQDVRLFPPVRKSQNASQAWKFGGFRMDASGYKLDTTCTVCSLCGLEINYKNTPTSLLQHLRNRHTEEFLSSVIDVSFRKEDKTKITEEVENIAEDMMMKLRENKWQCKVCSKYADTKNEMMKHVEVHMKRTLNNVEEFQ